MFIIATRYLPPVPVPPRSVIIERFPVQKKPGKIIIFFYFCFRFFVFFLLADIIIERWIPYGPQAERPIVIQPAPPAIKYPLPTHTIVIYDANPSRVTTKLEKLGVVQENPNAYISRYGTSLLDPATIVQEARNSSVVKHTVSF